jgi:hypothetical protein
VLDRISGSTGLEAAADACGVFERVRGQTDAILSLTGRDYDEDQQLLLRWDGLLHNWRFEGDAAAIRRSEASEQAVQLIRDSGPLRPAEAALFLGKTVEATKMLFSRLVQAGLLERVGGRYRIPTPPSQEREEGGEEDG